MNIDSSIVQTAVITYVAWLFVIFACVLLFRHLLVKMDRELACTLQEAAFGKLQSFTQSFKQAAVTGLIASCVVWFFTDLQTALTVFATSLAFVVTTYRVQIAIMKRMIVRYTSISA